MDYCNISVNDCDDLQDLQESIKTETEESILEEFRKIDIEVAVENIIDRQMRRQSTLKTQIYILLLRNCLLIFRGERCSNIDKHFFLHTSFCKIFFNTEDSEYILFVCIYQFKINGWQEHYRL